MATNLTGFIGGYTEMGTWLQDQARGELDMQKLGQEVQVAQEDMQSHKKMLEIGYKAYDAAKTQNGGVSPSAIETYKIFSDAAMGAGRPEEGLKMLSDSVKVQNDQVDLETKSWTLGQQSLSDMVAGLDRVHSQADLDKYYQNYFDTHPNLRNNPEMYMQMQSLSRIPYDPETIAQTREYGLSQIDKIKMKSEQALERARIADADKSRFMINKYYPAKLQQDERRVEAYEKHVGEGSAAKITKTDRSLGANLISQDYDLSDDKDQLYVLSTAVADRAREIVDDRPRAFKPMDKSTATKLAYDEMDKKGVFAGLTKKEPVFGTREHPASLPENPKDLVDNSVYLDRGRPVVYKAGEGFVALPPMPEGILGIDEESPPEDLSEGGEE